MATNFLAALYDVVASPWGPIHLAVTDRGVVAVEMLTTREHFAARLSRRLGAAIASRPDASPRDPRISLLDRARDELGEFLDGSRRVFDVPLDLPERSQWDRAVLTSVASIPWGAIASYGEVAGRIGRRGAARAVGGAVGRNPIGLLIPCHRVIAADGSLGGYGGDWYGTREERLAIKRELLEREGTRQPSDRRKRGR